MFTILLHSSKTMQHSKARQNYEWQEPPLLKDAEKLADYLKTLSVKQLQKAMALSEAKAKQTYELILSYSTHHPSLPALDIFLGDIYSGLQASTFRPDDRQYANDHLFILSGLYGVLRALDDIQPYRLEMGYKLPEIPNLYAYWGDKIANKLPKNQTIINLSAVEYTKAIFPYFKDTEGLNDVEVIAPKFLTISPKTNDPIFVTVHAKIARGAYARWLIQNRIETQDQLKDFNELGYVFNKDLSTPEQPVFVANEFKGIGLSVRLSKNDQA